MHLRNRPFAALILATAINATPAVAGAGGASATADIPDQVQTGIFGLGNRPAAWDLSLTEQRTRPQLDDDELEACVRLDHQQADQRTRLSALSDTIAAKDAAIAALEDALRDERQRLNRLPRISEEDAALFNAALDDLDGLYDDRDAAAERRDAVRTTLSPLIATFNQQCAGRRVDLRAEQNIRERLKAEKP